ncbi:substrate-binding periplasmic protein [Thalassospira marina]|uniref:Solute-binding protein family 3/N-terminal domain-containing protein n=1 Tax=Thalassospira marina TaxID=2048283 RepID=A0A2N3KZS5_9PROT|nr:hypothetical protein [Thalassospira marina]PKR55966.1 hypothetical protein COO20_01745 [Thalassospira marina]
MQDHFEFRTARNRAGRGRGGLLLLVSVVVLMCQLQAPHAQQAPSHAGKDAEKCLVMAMPEVLGPKNSYESYILAMSQAGLCVEPVWMPNDRARIALEKGEVDGIFARPAGFEAVVSVPVVAGTMRVGRVPEILVTSDPAITGLDDLKGQSIATWLGTKWTDDLLVGYANVVRVPGGPVMMQNMLKLGRVDAMLLDGYSLKVSGGVPAGFHAREIGEITVYSWLLARYSDYLPKLDAGTVIYRQNLQVAGGERF